MTITREEVIRWLISVKEEVDESEGTMIYISKKQADALCIAIEALSEPSGDLISRADAVKCVGWGDSVTEVINRIKSLPSAKVKTKCIAQIKIDRDDLEDLVNEKVNEIVDKMSETKTGKWIDKGDYAVCSECGGSSGTQFDGVEPIPRTTAFCPNCRAMMLREDGEA